MNTTSDERICLADVLILIEMYLPLDSIITVACFCTNQEIMFSS